MKHNQYQYRYYKYIKYIIICLILSLIRSVYASPRDKRCGNSCHVETKGIESSTLSFGRKHARGFSSECLQCHIPSKNSSLSTLPNKDYKDYNDNAIIVAGRKKKEEKDKKKDRAYSKTNMVLIPAGEFIMGWDDRWDDEKPKHKRYVNTFYIDIYELSNAKYKLFLASTKHTPPDHWREGSIPKGLEDHPVVFVSWYDADAYCRWAGKRLLTEAEWEKAARGTDGREFPWGNEFDMNKSNNPQKGSKGTEPVYSYENGRSPYGIYNMSGNAWEWVSDFYLPHPGNNIPNEEYGKKYRVVKGGSWYDCLFYGCGLSAPTYNRGFFVPETKNMSFGFRCGGDV